MKKLDSNLYLSSGTQSWKYVGLWEVAGEKLRVRITRNAFDHQSSAVIDVYSNASKQWNQLASIPYPQMACLPVSYVSRELSPDEAALFEVDERELLRLAALVIE